MDVLSSTDISREVLALVARTKQVLILVAAYFDPWGQLTTELKRAAIRPGRKVVLLLRGGGDRAGDGTRHLAREAVVQAVLGGGGVSLSRLVERAP